MKTFFRLIFGTILFAMLCGLMFLPVAFSIVGPARISKDVVERDEDLPLATPPAEPEAEAEAAK